MDTETATNPVEGDDTSLDTVATTQEVEAEGQETEYDDDGNPIEVPEDSEEVEHDGQKYKVPKAIKPLLLMQADYTRKTQELAEERKALVAERTQVQQASQAEVQAQAHIVAMDAQIAEYQNIDWDAWEAQDPFEAQKGWRQFQQAQQARANAANQFVSLRQQRTLAQQQETAKLIEEGRAVLARDIPGWSAEVAEKLLDAGVKQYGFSRAEIEEFTDPRMVKVLHDAHQYRLAQGKEKKAQGHVQAQVARPAAKVGGASAPVSGLDDRLSPAEWMKRREAQARKRG
jgi:hypothetical protein